MINYNLNTESKSIGGGVNELDLTKLSLVDLTSYSVEDLDCNNMNERNTLYYVNKDLHSSITNGPEVWDNNSGTSIPFDVQGGFSLLCLSGGIDYVNQILISYHGRAIYIRGQYWHNNEILWYPWSVLNPQYSNLPLSLTIENWWFSPNTFSLSASIVNTIKTLLQTTNNLILKHNSAAVYGLLYTRPNFWVITEDAIYIGYNRMENRLHVNMLATINLQTNQVTVIQET